MNFESLQQGIYSLVLSVSVAMSSTLLVPAPATSLVSALSDPEIVSSIPLSFTPDNYNIELPVSEVSASETEETPIENSKSEVVVPTPEVTVVLNEVTKVAQIAEVTVELPVKAKKTVQVVKKETKTEEEKPLVSRDQKKATPSEIPTPTPTPVLQKLAANAEKLFEMANEHRKNLGLPAFEKEEKICKIAEARAPQVYDEVFVEGPLHKGFKSLSLPFRATENMAAYSTIEQNFKFWSTHSIHKAALEGPSKYSCIACAGTSCSQIFTNFTPK